MIVGPKIPCHRKSDKHDTIVDTVMRRAKLICRKSGEYAHKCAEANTYDRDPDIKQDQISFPTEIEKHIPSDRQETGKRQRLDTPDLIRKKSCQNPSERIK